MVAESGGKRPRFVIVFCPPLPLPPVDKILHVETVEEALDIYVSLGGGGCLSIIMTFTTVPFLIVL